MRAVDHDLELPVAVLLYLAGYVTLEPALAALEPDHLLL